MTWVVLPTLSMSFVRMHFLHRRGARPRRGLNTRDVGMNRTMPAIVNRIEGLRRENGRMNLISASRSSRSQRVRISDVRIVPMLDDRAPAAHRHAQADSKKENGAPEQRSGRGS